MLWAMGKRGWLDEVALPGGYGGPVRVRAIVGPLLLGAVVLFPQVLVVPVAVLVAGYLWWLLGAWRDKAEFDRRVAWRRSHPGITDAQVMSYAPWNTGDPKWKRPWWAIF